MKNYRAFYRTGVLIILLFVISAFSSVAVVGQNNEAKILGEIEFDPEVDGFGFQNYGNRHKWDNDLDAGDLISLVGAAPVCVTGNTAATCRIKRPAENWRMKTLQAMGKGHCEGMAITSLLFFEEKEFKNRWKTPSQFQKGAENTFDLKFDSQAVQNYIAYFWATQMFTEIHRVRNQSIATGPLGIVKTLITSMNAEDSDHYVIGFCKYQNGKYLDCHAVTPIAVEDSGNYYTLHLYDNNNPGDTRYMTVEKGGQNQWKYNAAPNPETAENLYTGNKTTKSLHIAPISARLFGKKYKAPFATSRENAAVRNNQANFQNASFSNNQSSEMVEFSVNGDADMLITAGDGKRVGYDWAKQQTVNEIPGAEMIDLATDGEDELPPLVHLPFQPAGKPYTVVLSGKDIDSESLSDLTFTGPGFSVGFENIMLDPNETLTFQIASNGRQISFTSSADGETPQMYFTFNADNGESYLAEVGGIRLAAGKTLSGEFDPKAGKFRFQDNDADADEYDIDFERVLANGTEQAFETDDIELDGADDYEMDFGDWDGEEPMCFRVDDEEEGFADDECEEEPDEENDMIIDGENEIGGSETSDVNHPEPGFLRSLTQSVR